MSFYIDTSVLVAVLIDEPQSTPANAWWRSVRERMIVAELTAVEFSVVVSRGMRARRFDLNQAAEVLADMDLLRAECESLTHGRADFALAEQLVRDFSTKLAAPDALHLATSVNAGATLVTFDLRLIEAAQSRGANAIIPA